MPGVRRSLLLLALTSALGVAPGAAAASAETWVSYPRVLAAVSSGPLIRAIINPARGDVEIKFRDLDEWHAYYPPGAQATLQRLLAARHVRVLFVPRHRPASAHVAVHHHLRYVAVGVLGALALLACGAWLARRRRAARSAAAPPV